LIPRRVLKPIAKYSNSEPAKNTIARKYNTFEETRTNSYQLALNHFLNADISGCCYLFTNGIND
jgi:hypothetical protein